MALLPTLRYLQRLLTMHLVISCVLHLTAPSIPRLFGKDLEGSGGNVTGILYQHCIEGLRTIMNILGHESGCRGRNWNQVPAECGLGRCRYANPLMHDSYPVQAPQSALSRASLHLLQCLDLYLHCPHVFMACCLIKRRH
jgi:hypothetical protein